MTRPHFQPVSFSWVALHPQPRGVIQFIGGAFFGTFPTLFYRHLLQELYRDGYTLVAMPFRFSLRHWEIAYSLLAEQHRLRQILPDLARRQGYGTSVYRQASGYQWLGHSLGCKYIALLELLSGDADVVAKALPDRWRPVYRHSPGIWSQGSTLLAPDISDLDSAIPLRFLVSLLNHLGVQVQPDRQQTLDLIRQSDLFNLTAMISFSQDTVAGSVGDRDPHTSDVLWLYQYLKPKSAPQQELTGKHLEPIGWRIGPYIADFNPRDKFIKPLKKWQVAAGVAEFLGHLRQTAVAIASADSQLPSEIAPAAETAPSPTPASR